MPTKPDFGPCAECGVNNPHSATRCHKCGATLPWTQPKAPSAPVRSASTAPKIASDWDFKAIGV